MSLGTIASSGTGLQTGLKGWYRMLGGATDSSGNANTGTTHGSPSLTSDKYSNSNSAYQLVIASSQYISLAQTSGLPIYSIANAYTVAFWINAPAASGINAWVYNEGNTSSSSPGFGLYSNTAGNSAKLTCFVRNLAGTTILGAASTTTTFDSTWHHICWIDNLGTATLYIDGTADATSFNYTQSAIGAALNTSSIGAYARTTTGSFLGGTVFDVRLYNRALSAAEAHSLYAATQRI